jgi:galactokinase
MNPPLRLFIAFQQRYNDPPPYVLQVPGRDMWLAAAPSGNNNYTLVAPDFDATTVFDLRSARAHKTNIRRPLPRWSRYSAGVLVTLADEGALALPGVLAVIAGDEPAGPRYEYALGMAFAALWYAVNGQTCDENCLIRLLTRVQKRYVQP